MFIETRSESNAKPVRHLIELFADCVYNRSFFHNSCLKCNRVKRHRHCEGSRFANCNIACCSDVIDFDKCISVIDAFGIEANTCKRQKVKLAKCRFDQRGNYERLN